MDLTPVQAQSFQLQTQAITKTYRLFIQLVDQLPNGDVVIVAVHRTKPSRKHIYYIRPSGKVRYAD